MSGVVGFVFCLLLRIFPLDTYRTELQRATSPLPPCEDSEGKDCGSYEESGINWLFCDDDRRSKHCAECGKCEGKKRYRAAKRMSSQAEYAQNNPFSTLSWQQQVMLVPHEALTWLLQRFREAVEWATKQQKWELWRLERLRDFFNNLVHTLIHHHHDDEEMIYYPFLKKQCGFDGKDLISFSAQHETLLELMTRVRGSANLVILRSNVQDLETFWKKHLKDEEDNIAAKLKEKSGGVKCNRVVNEVVVVAMVLVLGSDLPAMSSLILHTMKHVWADDGGIGGSSIAPSESTVFRMKLHQAAFVLGQRGKNNLNAWDAHLKKALAYLRSVYDDGAKSEYAAFDWRNELLRDSFVKRAEEWKIKLQSGHVGDGTWGRWLSGHSSLSSSGDVQIEGEEDAITCFNCLNTSAGSHARKLPRSESRSKNRQPSRGRLNVSAQSGSQPHRSSRPDSESKHRRRDDIVELDDPPVKVTCFGFGCGF